MFLMQRSYDFKGRETSIEPRFSTGMHPQAALPLVAMSERLRTRPPAKPAAQQSSKVKVDLSELESAKMESRPTSGRDVDLSKLEAALKDSQPASISSLMSLFL